MFAKSNKVPPESCQTCHMEQTSLSMKSHSNMSALLQLWLCSILDCRGFDDFGGAIGLYVFCIGPGVVVVGLSNQLRISRMLLRHQLEFSHRQQLTNRVLKTCFKAVSDSVARCQVSRMDRKMCVLTRIPKECTNGVIEVPFSGSCARCHHFHNKIFLPFSKAATGLLRLHCESCAYYPMFGIGRALTRTSLWSLESLRTKRTHVHWHIE